MSLPSVKEKSKNQTVMPKWIPPPSGLAKVNIVDAALSKNRSIAACAAVARSKTGEFLGASVVVMDGIMNAEVSEALACGEGTSMETVWVNMAKLFVRSREEQMTSQRSSMSMKAGDKIATHIS
ncbi:hypothetical protein EJB05_49180, partial [Eragrostis curvula]